MFHIKYWVHMFIDYICFFWFILDLAIKTFVAGSTINCVLGCWRVTINLKFIFVSMLNFISHLFLKNSLFCYMYFWFSGGIGKRNGWLDQRQAIHTVQIINIIVTTSVSIMIHNSEKYLQFYFLFLFYNIIKIINNW